VGGAKWIQCGHGVIEQKKKGGNGHGHRHFISSAFVHTLGRVHSRQHLCAHLLVVGVVSSELVSSFPGTRLFFGEAVEAKDTLNVTMQGSPTHEIVKPSFVSRFTEADRTSVNKTRKATIEAKSGALCGQLHDFPFALPLNATRTRTWAKKEEKVTSSLNRTTALSISPLHAKQPWWQL
jgi:hypothetical protein